LPTAFVDKDVQWSVKRKVLFIILNIMREGKWGQGRFCVLLKTPIKKPRKNAIMNANKEIVNVVSHAVINQPK
jgi:hypothetical protein